MLMFSERRENYRIVLDESDRKLLSFKEILKGVIDPDQNTTEDFTDSLHDLATDNEKVSKLLAKSYLKGINQQDINKIEPYLQKIS